MNLFNFFEKKSTPEVVDINSEKVPEIDSIPENDNKEAVPPVTIIKSVEEADKNFKDNFTKLWHKQ